MSKEDVRKHLRNNLCDELEQAADALIGMGALIFKSTYDGSVDLNGVEVGGLGNSVTLIGKRLGDQSHDFRSHMDSMDDANK